MPNDLSIAAALGARLKERKETVAVSESSTGGLISAVLLAVPGASAYFLGGGVIYTQAARRGILQVSDDAVKGIRSSSEAYALVKARAIRERVGATWGLGETGATGPTGNRLSSATARAVGTKRSVMTATAGMPRRSAARASCILHDEQLPQSPMPDTTASAALSSPMIASGAGRLESALRRRTTSRTPCD